MRSWARPALWALDRSLGAASKVAQDAARTARFLHGRARFQERGDDVFVSSYPRSGTTWTLAVTHLVVSGEDGFDFAHQSDVAPWWERSLAWRAEAPEVFEALPSPRVFKTHLPRRWLPGKGRFLYAQRDPEDVAVSYFHLYKRYLGFEGDLGSFFERFLAGDLQYRSWFKHVAGWEALRDDPQVLVVRYEEMREDPVGWVRRIAGFLGAQVSDARAKRIAKLTDFSSMKAAEEKFDHEGEILRQLGIKPGAFLRQGQVGKGKEALDPAQRERLRKAMERKVRLAGVEWDLPAFLH